MFKGKLIRLEKISDDVFGGNHPNGINVGYKLQGYCLTEPRVGLPVFLYPIDKIELNPPPVAWISIVVSINGNTIKTANSTYSVTEIEEDHVGK